jgi:hypothetical protein
MTIAFLGYIYLDTALSLCLALQVPIAAEKILAHA